MIELGLQRISRLLANTSLPWRAIHVSGTNGKGSICAYISSMLETYNKSPIRRSLKLKSLKHARFTSPHLIDRWDCITINQQTVPFQLFDHVEQQVLKRNEQKGIKASEFELLTATAFEIFTREQVDIGVVEVGMGGRLDATNIIGQAPNHAPPLVTAIAKIGLDHQAFLGNTLPEIAREKAGIIKPGAVVVYDCSNTNEIIQVIEQSSKNRVVRLTDPEILSWLADSTFSKLLSDTLPVSMLPRDELGARCDPGKLQHSIIAEHTQRNMSVAFRSAWIALQGSVGLPKNDAALSKEERRGVSELAAHMLIDAIRNTQYPGRLQNLSIEALTGRKEPVLLDGAHNAQSAQVLAAEVNQRRAVGGHSAVTWVLAFSSTKDVSEILRIILQPGDSVFAVEFGPVDGMPWVEPLSSEKIVKAVGGLYDGTQPIPAKAFGPDVLDALTTASKEANGRPMIVAGSLYLVGDVLRLMRGRTTTDD